MNDAHTATGSFDRKRFCVHGHDTHQCGRNKQRFCRECARLRTETRRANPALKESDLASNRQRMTAKYRTDPQFREKVKESRRDAFRKTLIGCPPQPPVGSPCEICDGGRDKLLRADHDHETMKFRGWLCAKCNSGIGLLGDTLEDAQRAVRYLKKIYG
jgi:hypothetical protein